MYDSSDDDDDDWRDRIGPYSPRGGGRTGVGGGGPGSRTCLKCGYIGHVARDCPEDGGGGPDGLCYKCGHRGHLARDCPAPYYESGYVPGGGSRACFKCGGDGHYFTDCPYSQEGTNDTGGSGSVRRDAVAAIIGRSDGGRESWLTTAPLSPQHKRRAEAGEGGGSGFRFCLKCGGVGHVEQDCPKSDGGGPSRLCYKCGHRGHLATNCPGPYRESGYVAGGGGSRACLKCGGHGHEVKNCPQNVQRGGVGRPGFTGCYRCDDMSHMSKDCPRRNLSGPRACYKCGREGHSSWDCPRAAANTPKLVMNCFVCGSKSHMPLDCPYGETGYCRTCNQAGHIQWSCPKNEENAPSPRNPEQLSNNRAEERDATATRRTDGGHVSSAGRSGLSGSGISVTGSSVRGRARSRSSGGGGAGSGVGFRPCYRWCEDNHPGKPCPFAATGVEGDGGEADDRRECLRCGEEGHFVMDCPRNQNGGREAVTRAPVCYHCHEPDHQSHQCPSVKILKVHPSNRIDAEERKPSMVKPLAKPGSLDDKSLEGRKSVSEGSGMNLLNYWRVAPETIDSSSVPPPPVVQESFERPKLWHLVWGNLQVLGYKGKMPTLADGSPSVNSNGRHNSAGRMKASLSDFENAVVNSAADQSSPEVSSLTTDLKHLYCPADSFPDLKFRAKDGVILSGHRFILAAKSPMLCRLIDEHIKLEGFNGTIHMDTVDSKPFLILLHWMYTGELHGDVENVLEEVVEICTAFEIRHLLAILEMRLVRICTKDNMLSLFGLAHRSGMKTAFWAIFEFIKRNLGGGGGYAGA